MGFTRRFASRAYSDNQLAYAEVISYNILSSRSSRAGILILIKNCILIALIIYSPEKSDVSMFSLSKVKVRLNFACTVFVKVERRCINFFAFYLR